jgi:hypothetical protein
MAKDTKPRKPVTLKDGQDLEPSDPLYARALQDLGIDKPVYYCRIVGGRLEFHLYGGTVLWWTPRKETS